MKTMKLETLPHIYISNVVNDIHTDIKHDVHTDIKHDVIKELKKDLQKVKLHFLDNIKYKPSIDKYCLEDILRLNSKSKKDLLRLPSMKSFMNKYPDLFTTVKKGLSYENIYVDYKVIPSLLYWIDFSRGYEFQNKLPKSKPDRSGYIYLVQNRNDVKRDIFKVGRTYNINERYQGKVNIIEIEHVDNMYDAEKKLIKKFKQKYGKPIRGNEYFKCNDIEEAKDLFYSVANLYEK